MIEKILGSILIITVLFQIAFSFYYSSEILNQNNLIYTNQSYFDSIKIQNQELEKKLALITSISNIKKQIETKNYIPISQMINLKN